MVLDDTNGAPDVHIQRLKLDLLLPKGGEHLEAE